MTIPNADRAIFAPEKITGYLLNVSPKRGGPKARLLLSVGYRVDDPQRLELDLRTQHLSLDVTRTVENAYGVVYEIEGPIKTPSARLLRFCSIWQLDTGSEVPKLDMYGDVILTRVTEHGLRAGDVGTIVERHAVPGVSEEGYSVECYDMTGNTVAVVTLPASALRLNRSAPKLPATRRRSCGAAPATRA
jgi:Domain of unknown function (DUF4926)